MSSRTVDPNLILHCVCHSDGSSEYILANKLDSGLPTKLGHAFEFLPPGILHKEETGIGATTLELNSRRNSIIVEPLRSTALNKSQISKDYFYVGTKTSGEQVTIEEIRAYVARQEQSEKFVKLICVADSLFKVIDALGREKIDKDAYHLLIDESDSFQTASSYRKSMELVLDQYKKYFRPELRSMVTATPLVFTDPELRSEPITKFRYEHPQRQDLHLIYTDKVKGKLLDLIEKHFKERPKEKLVVAYNNLSDIRAIADKFVEKRILDTNEIKVLCSSGKKDNVKKYFQVLEDNILPGKLVFKTSAYFVGYDLDEPYHLIIGTSTGNNVLQLSELTIKQIIGRARKGLESVTVVSSQKILKEVKRFDELQLLDIAHNQLEGYRCLVRNFEKSIHLLDEVLKLKERVEDAMHIGGFTLVRRNLAGKPDISYLNIDGYIEQTRVKKDIYSINNGLEKALTKIGFNVISNSENAVETVKISEEQLNELKAIKSQVEKNLPGTSGTFDRKLLEQDGIPESEKLAYELYSDYQNYIDEDFLKEQIVDKMSLSSEGGSKKSLNVFAKVLYYHLLEPSEPFKRHILSTIKISERYSEEYLLTCVNDAFALGRLHNDVKDYRHAKKILNYFFEINADKRETLKTPTEITNQKIKSYRRPTNKSKNKIDFPEPKKYKSLDVARFRSDIKNA